MGSRDHGMVEFGVQIPIAPLKSPAPERLGFFLRPRHPSAPPANLHLPPPEAQSTLADVARANRRSEERLRHISTPFPRSSWLHCVAAALTRFIADRLNSNRDRGPIQPESAPRRTPEHAPRRRKNASEIGPGTPHAPHHPKAQSDPPFPLDPPSADRHALSGKEPRRPLPIRVKPEDKHPTPTTHRRRPR
jgi:hypothetical protein